jgi:hypothetical protein
MNEHARDLANVYRRLDHLMATGRSLPRAPITPGPKTCRVCADVECDKPACLRAIMSEEEKHLFRERLAYYAAAAARDARTHRNGSR